MSATLVAVLTQLVPPLEKLTERAFTDKPKSGSEKRSRVLDTLLPVAEALAPEDGEVQRSDLIVGIGKVIDGTVVVMNAVNALREDR